MIRRLFTIACAFSLLLCIVTVVVCVRSYWQADGLEAGYWHYQQHGKYRNYYDAWQLRVLSSRGRMTMGIYLCACVAGPGRHEETPGQKGKFLVAGAADSDRLREANLFVGTSRISRGGLGFRGGWDQRERALSIPHAAVVGLTAVLPLIAAGRMRRRRRNDKMGLCRHCGYDLRASKEHCSECGNAIPVKT